MDHILIIDGNVAFATVLKESLERDGGYQATVVSSGDEALQTLKIADFNLAIVDLGLTDPDGVTLVREIRRQKAGLPLMLIPAGDDGVPPELKDVPIQGVLAMPFFFPELPGRVAEALASSASSAPAAGPVAAKVNKGSTAARPAAGGSAQPARSAAARPAMSGASLKAAARSRASEITRELDVLARDINADAALLTQGDELIAHTGRLAVGDVNKLAQAVAGSWSTAAQVAQVLGRKQVRFEQSTEGGEFLLYSVAVAEDVILSVALSAGVPLGMVRHRAKDVADALRALMGAA